MYTNNNTLTGNVESLKQSWNDASTMITGGIDGSSLDDDLVDDGI